MEEGTGAKSKRDRGKYIQFKCRVPKENNKRRKTRNLFRKTGNIRGAFHPKMCTIKDKNSRDLVDTRQWHPTPVLLPGKSHGWRSLEGCSPWGH